MQEQQTVETQDLASLRSMIDLLTKRDAVFPWEAAFSLKIKTSEAIELLSELVNQRKAEQFTVESTVKECTEMGCVGCDCTNSYVKKEIKYRRIDFILSI